MTRLAHSLSTLRRSGSPLTHARLGSGGRQLCRVGLGTHWVPIRDFTSSPCTSFLGSVDPTRLGFLVAPTSARELRPRLSSLFRPSEDAPRPDEFSAGSPRPDELSLANYGRCRGGGAPGPLVSSRAEAGATSKPSRVGSTEPRKEVQGEEVKSRIGTQWVPNPTRQSWRPPEPSLALVRGDPDLRSVDRECASRVTEPRNAQSDGWPIRPHGQQQPAHVQPVSWTRRGLRAGRACIGVP